MPIFGALAGTLFIGKTLEELPKLGKIAKQSKF